MKIFISWSKSKSKDLAMETKKFLQNTFGKSLEIFFSPDLYKGTCVDHEIHKNLLKCDKCIVCITAENYKNPWLMYEAGVIYGAHHNTPGGGIVIPILFEQIPQWSSWIDKPLNRYVPLNFNSNDETDGTQNKQGFQQFFQEIEKTSGITAKNFNTNWKKYITNVQAILDREQLIPTSCISLFTQLMNDASGNFLISNPEITKEHILFHKGFSTNALFRLLLKNVIEYQSQKLWIFGRRNKKLMTGENDDFFKFLADEGLQSGIDFKCLFPYPGTEATNKAVSLDKERRFKADLQTCLEAAVRMNKRFDLPVSDMFRLYKCHRKSAIIVSDEAVLHSQIICDSDGRPLPMTNSSFEILSISQDGKPENKGRKLYNSFIDIWDSATPLTEELYNELYDLN